MSVPWNDTTVDIGVHPIETDGEHAVLRYDLTVTPDGSAAPPPWSSFTLNLGGPVTSAADGRGIRLFDAGAGLAYPVAQAGDGAPAARIEQLPADDAGRAGAAATGEAGAETAAGAAPDASAAMRGQGLAVFAAPEGDTVDVLLPRFGAVLDVPVVPPGDAFAAAVESAGGAGEAGTKRLRAFTSAYDAGSATSAEDDEVTVTLASDVLFDPDEHTLSRDARGVVDQAVGKIREQADGGRVDVVGHTDDVDTDAYNLQLSERRAASVADRLQAALGDGYDVTEEGRGETEPVAPGTSDPARAANRRVEISFQGRLVVSGDDAGDVPGTDAPTVENGPVTLRSPDGEYVVEVASMVRRPGAIVGTLTAERTGGDGIDVDWFLPSYLNVVGDRNFGVVAELTGPHNLSLLTPDGHVFPYDYRSGTTEQGFTMRRLLGDEQTPPLQRGDTTVITVVWPDTGQDTVTVDGRDRFRVTDVPVTDAP
ncbi:OmpA family protein [Myceligenerans crystallogenes]|uniref:OmpA family protein n=1 Tax=Myceligenerans crystallogenes TaxID=316335 RepID=UPI0031DEF216